MIALATIAFNKPRLIAEQIRLLDKYLNDEYRLLVYDASTDEVASLELLRMMSEYPDDSPYWLLTRGENAHDAALNEAAQMLLNHDAPFIGFLDHDIFPTQPTTLIDKIQEAGFYGVGQRHAPTGHLYLWPGFCFFSREWLAGRELDFTGIRADNPADNGDTGSGLWPLFALEDWSSVYQVSHGYRAVREPDGYGLQSWGVETFGDWLHLSNGSGWMDVPDPEGRERILKELVAGL